MAQKRLTTSAEAVTADVQHTKPCHDCPWSRDALRGWLGGGSVEEWLDTARSDAPVPCHTIKNQQCAGIAIFRRNTCKLVVPPALLLPADREAVFASPGQFQDHHTSFFKGSP